MAMFRQPPPITARDALQTMLAVTLITALSIGVAYILIKKLGAWLDALGTTLGQRNKDQGEARPWLSSCGQKTTGPGPSSMA